MSTSFEGLGAVLPPPNTHILLLKLSARVSPVARGMLVIVPILSATGLYTNESVASVIRPPEIAAPPPVKIMVPIVVVGR